MRAALSSDEPCYAGSLQVEVDRWEVGEVTDADIATFAHANGRAVVTENVADFAAERDVVLVFVLKRSLPAGGARAAALAELLHRWVREHPDPYLGPHWPQ